MSRDRDDILLMARRELAVGRIWFQPLLLRAADEDWHNWRRSDNMQVRPWRHRLGWLRSGYPFTGEKSLARSLLREPEGRHRRARCHHSTCFVIYFTGASLV